MPRIDKKIKFFGEVLQDGVWIYVVDVTHLGGKKFLCVATTGIESESEPTSPLARLTAHMDDAAQPLNCLKLQLEKNVPEFDIGECVFEITCFGPKLVGADVDPSLEFRIMKEAAAQLADRLTQAGYLLVGNYSTIPDKFIKSQAEAIVDDIVDSLRKSYLRKLR